MTIANPTHAEQARADFIRQSNMEARLCLDAERRARRINPAHLHVGREDIELDRAVVHVVID